MSDHREAWLCVLQDADGNQETELIWIEPGWRWVRAGDRADQRGEDHLYLPGGCNH